MNEKNRIEKCRKFFVGTPHEELSDLQFLLWVVEEQGKEIESLKAGRSRGVYKGAAWKKWRESETGKKCLDARSLGLTDDRQAFCLSNRLWEAFIQGAIAAEER